MTALPPKETRAAKPLVLHLDMEKYLGQLEDWDIDEAQGREFIKALWDLLRSFAEMGFDIHPVQQAQKACGQVSQNPSKAALTNPNELYLENADKAILNKDFSARAAGEKERIRR